MFHMEQSQPKKHNKVIGNHGETIACNYLIKKGFKILERNYLKKWGEIDIVARVTQEKITKVHFVEVKTVSYETKAKLKYYVSRDTWKPEDNVSPFKLKKLNRAIESWIMENNYKGDWQIDIISVKVVPREKYATVKYIPNVILA